MKIDKNNWFIREDSLTEEQHVEVCKYLVENYKAGGYSLKIYAFSQGHFSSEGNVWDFVGVINGFYTSHDKDEQFSPYLITYQDFLNYIKETEWIELQGDTMYLDPETIVEIKLPESTQSFKAKVGGVDWFLLALSHSTIKYRIIPEDFEEATTTLPECKPLSLQELTDHYVKAVRCLTSDTTVSYNIFINSKGVEITEDKRTSETLKKSGISMKNIKGDYIK